MQGVSTRQAEIAAEQQYVDKVYARLLVMREEAKAMIAAAHERGLERLPAALVERDAMVHHATRQLKSLEAEYEGLVFGRLDQASGEIFYIGRLGVRDADFDTMVIDWRAPVAGAFYQATAEQPMDVVRRRVIRCSGGKVLHVDDELLTPEAVPEGLTVVGDGALMATLARARGPVMRDIVGTIQREQDDAIRAPAEGITEITGGPGTGKTAVALHRAAYLMYRNRRRFNSGVLVVGPSPVFMNYISRVLPSLGEDTVELRALGEVLDGVKATRTDSADVAVAKGSLRMRRVLVNIMKEAPPGAPTELRIVYSGQVLKLEAHELVKVRKSVHSRRVQPNQARKVAADALLEALWQKASSYSDNRFNRKNFVVDIADRNEFVDFVAAWWPPVLPTQVLGWLGDRERLRRAAKRNLSPAEVEGVAASWAEPDAGWSVADVAVLDELRVLLGDPPRQRRAADELDEFDMIAHEVTSWHQREHGQQQLGRADHYDHYSHVIVDEAQDLSPMQWRMLGRRGKYASWTIVGDPVQSSWPDAAEAADAKERALGKVKRRRRFLLRTNYRNSSEIFELAADVVRDVVDPDDLPTAVRSTGLEPDLRTVSDVPNQTVAAAKELLDQVDGTVGVIGTMARRAELASWVAELGDRVQAVGSLEAKGMEYDAVVLVEPTELITESLTGLRALYVALTRATQRLTVVASDTSWRE
ncbi:AAA family ATPase [Allokutzneria sp. A3M-2-11 16]|uniref:HelD family protein n=1 Tax=Allokutzneria sp. A3M-2-11 16 TaxID=2962043 RepID=UPI0020B709FC|nr:UvrD-helicase domain-containing protein [Allokutzneria sp. A3M-2-11 16]MCP3801444.1 AAA family ATPase [Allokutzneria sp. A3M-2-11 16]